MWGQLNVEMDSLAKAYWNETHNTTPVFTQCQLSDGAFGLENANCQHGTDKPSTIMRNHSIFSHIGASAATFHTN
jgi:hypothetical protein